MTRRSSILSVSSLAASPFLLTRDCMAAELPDPRLEWPPFFTTQWDIVKNWLGSVHFKKTDLKCGAAIIICLDIAPFSGQPARHVVLYQSMGDKMEGLVTLRVFKPSLPDVDLQFVWSEPTERIKIYSGDTLCLEVPLKSLLI